MRQRVASFARDPSQYSQAVFDHDRCTTHASVVRRLPCSPDTSFANAVLITRFGFYNRLRDRITFVVFGDGTATHLNVGKVRYAGGDASLTWRPLKPMMLKGSYGFLDATDTDTGNWLPGKSRHAGSLLVQLRPHNAVSVSLIARAQSHAFRDARNVVELPAYWLAEVKVEHTRGRATIFSEASNLLDRSYLSSDGYLAPPRTWFVGVNYRM